VDCPVGQFGIALVAVIHSNGAIMLSIPDMFTLNELNSGRNYAKLY